MRRRRYHQPEEVVKRECASVHILRSEEELEEAIRRASEFDRRTAAVLESRFEHYQTFLARLPVEEKAAESHAVSGS